MIMIYAKTPIKTRNATSVGNFFQECLELPQFDSHTTDVVKEWQRVTTTTPVFNGVSKL